MKRAIAMRCTQEQFDSIKDRIELSIKSVTDFKEYPYLINFGDKKYISNIDKSNYWDNFWKQNPKIFETFNADIFLEACGVEVEKPIMQIFSCGVWVDYAGKYRLKQQPNYEKEIEALQQKAKENGMKCIINFEKLC